MGIRASFLQGHGTVEYRWTVLESVHQQTLAIYGKFVMASYCTISPIEVNIAVLGPPVIVHHPEMSYLPNVTKLPNDDLLGRPSSLNAGAGMREPRRFEMH